MPAARGAEMIFDKDCGRRRHLSTVGATSAAVAMSENGEQPFLRSEECIDFLRSYGRVMLITRGLPGSGKAGIAETVKRTYPGSKVISADQMFLGIGAVDKTIETTTEAHLLCQKRTEEALQGNTSVVMNRNNNATVRETARYIELAAKYGYLVIVIDTLQKEDMTVEATLGRSNRRQVSQG